VAAERDRWAIERITLRFRDGDLERSFQAAFARQNLTNLRVGHLLGAILWVVWGALIAGHLGDQGSFDFLVRYGLLIPIVLIAATTGGASAGAAGSECTASFAAIRAAIDHAAGHTRRLAPCYISAVAGAR
jgi:hypothetical protein